MGSLRGGRLPTWEWVEPGPGSGGVAASSERVRGGQTGQRRGRPGRLGRTRRGGCCTAVPGSAARCKRSGSTSIRLLPLPTCWRRRPLVRLFRPRSEERAGGAK